MTDRGLKVLAAVLGTALAVVLVAGPLLGSRSVGHDLTDRVEDALTAAGLDDVAVEVSGREVDLRPATERDLVRATRVAERVEGVRWARLAPDIGSTDLRPVVSYLDLETVGSSVRISGAVHDATTAAELKASAAAAFDTTVRGDVTIDPTLPEAEWTEQLPGAFGDLAALKDVSLSVDDGDVLRLKGRIESTQGRDRIISLATSGIPSLRVDADLDVDAGRLSPDDAAILDTVTIFYSSGGVELTDEDRTDLDRVVGVLDRTRTVSIQIVGHTGPDSPERGRADARERVDLVQEYLADQGVAVERMTVKTYVSSHREDADQRFRRVDLVVKGA